MTDPCDSLHPYVDGELDDGAAARFEAHLATCRACGAELPRVLDLIAALDAATRAVSLPARISGLTSSRSAARGIEDSLLPVSVSDLPVRDVHAIGTRASAVSAQAPRPARRRWFAAVAVPALAAAAAVLLLVIARPAAPPPAPRGLSLAALDAAIGPTRRIAARVSLPGADRYRPIDVPRGGNDTASDALLQLERDLEQAKDWHAAAVVALLAGDREHAARAFARAPASPELDSDRAAFELLDGSPPALERALDNVDHALAAAPRSATARWNRGLVLAAMQLPMAAALEFDAVHALGEPGWASDAQRRARDLRAQVVQRRARWRQAYEAGRRLVESGDPIPANVAGVTGVMTLMLYDAVRSAPSRERALALLPLAGALDQAYQSTRLTDYVRRVADSNFRIRKPFADSYRDLALGRASPADTAALLERLARTTFGDIRLGAMVFAGQVDARLDDYHRLARAANDPWFLLNAEQETARRELARHEVPAAERRLRYAMASARHDRITYRELRLGSDLVALHKGQLQLAQAADEARAIYRSAISAGEWLSEMSALSDLASIHHNRYSYALARGYLTELAERAEAGLSSGVAHMDCLNRMYAYGSLANISVMQRDPDRARAELDRVPTCDAQASPDVQATQALRNALVRSELYRLGHRPDDRQLARASIAALRRPSSGDAPGKTSLLDYLDGSLTMQDDLVAGQRLLRSAVDRAGRANDEFSVKARAYSLSLLALEFGRSAAFDQALATLAEANNLAEPDRCTVAVATDSERSVVVFRDAAGLVGGEYAAPPDPRALAMNHLISRGIVDRLRPCARVSVITRAPVLGSARLLPPEIAWSYRLANPPSPSPDSSSGTTAGKRLVVTNPDTPAELQLPVLETYSGDTRGRDDVVLRGADATPSRVLQEMRDASVIEFHTHGFIADDLFDASHLVLSPELDHQYALTPSDVLTSRLTAWPLVILAACHAATSSRVLEGGIGLPEALLRSGARAVIASPDSVPDLAAAAFFASVRDRVLRGADPAIALRDERVQHLTASPDDTWVLGVIVFQ